MNMKELKLLIEYQPCILNGLVITLAENATENPVTGRWESAFH